MAIHLPWTDGCCAYIELDNHEDISNFMKRKRTQKTVIYRLGGDLFPVDCALCGKPITEESGNRVDVYPKLKKVFPYHYECAWKMTFAAIDRLIAKCN